MKSHKHKNKSLILLKPLKLKSKQHLRSSSEQVKKETKVVNENKENQNKSTT